MNALNMKMEKLPTFPTMFRLNVSKSEVLNIRAKWLANREKNVQTGALSPEAGKARHDPVFRVFQGILQYAASKRIFIKESVSNLG